MSSEPVFLRDTEIGNQLKQYNVFSYEEAIKFINELPYGRNQNPKIASVLNEQKGTCSTKHAFLAVLAAENSLPIKLMFGYYQMNQENTPQIGNTLEKYHLPYILEGHCYLKHYDQIIDVTFPGEIKSKLDFDIIDEKEISPFELYKKPSKHKQKLKDWLKLNPNYPLQDIDQLWAIREYCIQTASSAAEKKYK